MQNIFNMIEFDIRYFHFKNTNLFYFQHIFADIYKEIFNVRDSCVDPENLVRRGPILTTLFYILFILFSLMRGGRTQIPLLA